MAAKTEEALEKRRAYHREWHRKNKSSPEDNRRRYAQFKKKLEDPEFREAYNAKQRERKRAKAAAKRAAETEAQRAAKRQRWLEAVVKANQARAKAPEDRAVPKPRAKPVPDLAQAITSYKRKPGRLVASFGWRGTGF
jgi:hypothetical protein